MDAPHGWVCPDRVLGIIRRFGGRVRSGGRTAWDGELVWKESGRTRCLSIAGLALAGEILPDLPWSRSAEGGPRLVGDAGWSDGEDAAPRLGPGPRIPRERIDAPGGPGPAESGRSGRADRVDPLGWARGPWE